MRLIPLLLLALATAGCRPAIPDGRFGCMTDGDCPPGQRCAASVCTAGSLPDSGTPADAPIADVGPDPIDAFAGTDDAATRPVTLRIVNAVLDDRGAALPSITVSIGARMESVIAGCPEVLADVPSSTTVDVTFGDVTTPIPVSVSRDSLVVIARDADGAPAAYVTPEADLSGTAGHVAVRVLSAIRSAGAASRFVTNRLADPVASTSGATFGDWTEAHEHPIAEPIAIGLSQPAGATPRLIGTFDLGMADTDGYVALIGDERLHPGAPGGPRALWIAESGSTCSLPVLPDAQIVAINLATDHDVTTASVYVCQLDATFPPIELRPGEPSAVTSAFLGLTEIGVARTTMACSAPDRTVDLAAPLPAGLEPGHRYLVTVWRRIGFGPSVWQISIAHEPVPPTAASPGGTVRVPSVFQHLGPEVAPFPVDTYVLGVASGMDVFPDAIHATVGDPFPMGTSISLEIRHGETSATVAAFDVSALAAHRSGSFLMFRERDLVPGGTMVAPELALVLAPYGAQWTSRYLAPGP